MKLTRKTLSLFIAIILVFSLFPIQNVAEANNPNQRNAIAQATEAVENAEQQRTWETVNIAQNEIDSLGNGRPIRDDKQRLQDRLEIVKIELNQRESEKEPIEEDPIEEDPVIKDPNEDVYHIVVSGDTLWLISIQYGVTVNEIKELNNLQSDVIFVGQKLLISKGDKESDQDKESKELIVLGYYTKYWNNDLGSYHSLTANHQYLNAIATASVDINFDGSITGFIPHEGIDFANRNDVFIYATFQNHFNPDLTRAIFTNPSLQETVINNMITFVKEHGYKGANLNFENMYASDRERFNVFVEKMTEAFHKEGFPVMVSVPAKTCDCPTWAWSGTFDFAFLGNSKVDYIQIMSYDQHGSWSQPGSIAGYDWMKTVFNYATTHIPAEKILMGLPAYGYSWNTSTNSGHQALTLKQIDSIIATHNPEIKWDEHEKTPYFHYVDGAGHNRTVYFENVDSLALKTSLVHDYNLAGVSMWRMGQENDSFWPAVKKGLEK
ncbi:spore germination protein YaaH [Evansella vedderi]|uniref:Spore germination protein YaaH n=1 Tax=Evansella vedderi TaxID=38282 RepID=A0ABT9ZVH6_9BACI|nr:glycosyl hydrolase family 18 protein [Evansella vedderi]MDQ0254742.1 spore germination protein YaaH [Evansella vedderi]